MSTERAVAIVHNPVRDSHIAVEPDVQLIEALFEIRGWRRLVE
jgi:hypothetical protein